MAKNKEDYLIEKGKIADPAHGKLYVVSSNREGATMKVREVWGIEKGPSRSLDGGKNYTPSKRYILKGEFPYEMDIYAGEISGEDHGYGTGVGDLWSWSYFAFLDGKEAEKKLHEEKERIAITYLGKKPPAKHTPGTIHSNHIASDDQVTVFGAEIIDAKAVGQLKNCLTEGSIGVLTADAHYGYSMPVGGCVAYKDYISPSGVGFDIACGNYAVRTNIQAYEIDVAKVMDEIVKKIGFGVGRPNPRPIHHPVLDKIAKAEFEPQRKLYALAKQQIGTVGSGNHFIDLFEDEKGFLWIGVHFGSRGFGHKTASGFLSMAQGLGFTDKVTKGSMDSKPTLFDIHSDLGQAYISAMELAGEYAYAGRETVVNQVVFDILKGQKTFEVHNHHNFAWLEEHFGDKYWVVRKGCTPAQPGQLGFIGANMADNSVIIEGVDSELSKKGLYSTVHGAGRIMSRTEAAGKKKWIKDEKTGRKSPVIVSKGKIDFDEVKKEMSARKIELRGAGADEAPGAYKSLEDVLKYQGDTIRVLHRLRPIGVAMAGPEIEDPYRD